MSTDTRHGVGAAFEGLMVQLDAYITSLHESGAVALRQGDYKQARSILDQIERVQALRDRSAAIKEEWEATVVAPIPVAIPTSVGSQGADRLRSAPGSPPRATSTVVPKDGPPTPDDKFRRPILVALDEMGGVAALPAVFHHVAEQMQQIFTRGDLEPHPSLPDAPYWQYKVDWVGYTLSQQGYIRRRSQDRWELTDTGRATIARD